MNMELFTDFFCHFVLQRGAPYSKRGDWSLGKNHYDESDLDSIGHLKQKTLVDNIVPGSVIVIIKK